MKKAFIILGSLVFIFLGCKDETAQEVITIVTPQEVYDAVYNKSGTQLIDVRTREEFDEGHLNNAYNVCITNTDFKEKAAKLDKQKPVYLYCKGGGRSAKAAEILKEMGFKEIYDMEGGFMNWESQGLQKE